MLHSRSTLPLFPTDDGWPYPDGHDDRCEEDGVDLDVLELRADPHAFAALSERERFAVDHRFGFVGTPWSMKVLARELGCSHAEARDVLGGALVKLRARLGAP